jgi:hypothetical protein
MVNIQWNPLRVIAADIDKGIYSVAITENFDKKKFIRIDPRQIK